HLQPSGAFHRAWLRRWPVALRAGHRRHAARVSALVADPGRLRTAGAARRPRRALCDRRMGLRRHRQEPRRVGPRRDVLGRGGRLPAGAGDRARRPLVAGGGVFPVPRFRRGEAAADTAAGNALQGRLWRDVRRHPRRRVYASGPGFGETGFSMNLAVLSRKTGKALKMKGQTLATAESCTGGWVEQAVTSVAGSSEWFERGYVTYSNAAKRESLGVAKKTLLRYGAVSEPT